MFSKRFSLISILLIVSVFLPWFSVNLVLTKLSLPGYKVGPLGIILIILGVAGLVGSTLKAIRFRGLVEAIIGAVSLILVLLSNAVVHHVIANNISNMFGGSSDGAGLFSGSSQASQLSGLIASPTWGFYVGVVCSLALFGLGARAIFLYKYEPLVPSNVASFWYNERFQEIRAGALESASAAVVQARDVDWNGKRSKLLGNRKLIYGVGGGVVVVAAYFISMAVYNSLHSLNHQVKALMTAVESKNSAGVGRLITTQNKIEPAVLNAFVEYYAGNSSALKTLLSPLQNQSNESQLAQMLSTDGVPQVIKHSVLGFTSYHIEMPTPELKLTIPNKSKVSIGGSGVSKNLYTLPAVYNVKVSASTPFGPVTTSQQEDTTSGDVQAIINFPQTDTLNVNSPDLQGDVELSINGKTSSVDLKNAWGGNVATVRPIPDFTNQNATVSLKEPWGDYEETGTVQNGQVTLQPASDSNNTTFQAIVKDIDEFNVSSLSADSTGNYKSVLKYLAPDGQDYASFQSKSGKSQQTQSYLSMTASPTMQLVKLGNGDMGLAVNDTETYSGGMFGNQQIDWVYNMEYDKSAGTWKIFNAQQTYQTISAGAPNYTINH